MLLVDAGAGEADQHQQGRHGEAEVELHQARQLRPGLYLPRGRVKAEERAKVKQAFTVIVKAQQTLSKNAEVLEQRGKKFQDCHQADLIFIHLTHKDVLLLSLAALHEVNQTFRQNDKYSCLIRAAAAHRPTWCRDQFLVSRPQVWRQEVGRLWWLPAHLRTQQGTAAAGKKNAETPKNK